MSTGSYDYAVYWTGLHRRHTGALCAVGYSRLGEGFNRATYKLRRRAAMRLLSRRPGLCAGRLLEAAVGVGAYAPVWRELGVRSWTGLDLSPDAVAYCRSRFPYGNFVVQDLTAEDWDPSVACGDYDLVTAIDVLYHLTSDQDFDAALLNLERRVKLGGALLISGVFPPKVIQAAPHVKHRPLEAYQRVLGKRMVLADREPVFALLGNPFPRPGRIQDRCLSAVWKGLALTLLHTPPGCRDAAGTALVAVLRPMDHLLRRLGFSRSVNLELALFVKTR